MTCHIDNKFYLTTAISYTNGHPHIGHAYEFIISDFIARFYRIRGKDVLFLTGTDEHGQKIERTAKINNRSPIEQCNAIVEKFKELNIRYDVSYDNFIRTTDDVHIDTVKDILERCNNDIYLDKYTGWYDMKEETYINNNDAEIFQYKNKDTGEPLIQMNEQNYFFRLSKYQTAIKEYIESNPNFIFPQCKRTEILNRLQFPLEDISITRTSINWGIPYKDNHVIYVWFDALINYISGCKNIATKEEFKEWWPADVHIIGKDILWFHAVIWLGMLISANIPLPKRILVHDFIIDDKGYKMSKSLGNVVEPMELSTKYPVSVIRYFLLKNTTFESDIKFDYNEVIRCNDNELLPKFGNLVSRVFGLINRYSENFQFHSKSNPLFIIKDEVDVLDQLISDFNIRKYIEYVFDKLNNINKYIGDSKVWQINNNKYNDERNEYDRSCIIKTVTEALFILTHFIYPIMPDVCKNLFEFYITHLNLLYVNDNMKLPLCLQKLSWTNLNDKFYTRKFVTPLLFSIIDADTFNIKKNKNINKKANKTVN